MIKINRSNKEKRDSLEVLSRTILSDELSKKDFCQDKMVQNPCLNEFSFQNTEKWNGFKTRFEEEFDDKIELIDSIRTSKCDGVKFTWVSVFKKYK